LAGGQLTWILRLDVRSRYAERGCVAEVHKHNREGHLQRCSIRGRCLGRVGVEGGGACWGVGWRGLWGEYPTAVGPP